MKSSILSMLVFVSIFSSCKKDLIKEDLNTINITNPQTMQEMIVPVGFSYKTTQDVTFTIKLLANNDKPLVGVRIDIMNDMPENGGKIISTGTTNLLGVLNMPYNVPLSIREVILNINYIGIVNNVIVPINVNSPNVNITIGGKNPMKVITAENKNQVKTSISLGKSFSRLSYKLGTFNTAGVPNYLVLPSDVVSSQFLADVNAALPEHRSVPTYSPQFLASNLERNLVLTAQSDVWVTFVHDGASFLNSLFYFTYNKNNKPTSVSQIDSLIAIMPNVSYAGSGGGMTTGDKVYLGHFGADTAIGFAIAQNGFNGTTVNSGATFLYSINGLNPETTAAKREHTVLLYENTNQRFVIGFEDVDRDNGSDNDFNDCVIYATANPTNSVNRLNVIDMPSSLVDIDGDGVLNAYDEYPTDPTRAYIVYYPNAATYATVAFEDLWPNQGDYDMNDVVVNYQYKGVLNANNKMVDLTAKYKLRAAGGVFKNAFSVELPFNKSQISGIYGGLGLDAVANKAIIKVFANSIAIIPAFNTFKGQTSSVTDTITISMNFNTPQNITLGSFNPFIWVDEPGKGRGHEIHLPDYTPTELVNMATFGTEIDNSIPANSRYYKTILNLPFAINIPETFDYPAEKESIILSHLKFAAWAQSGGVQYQDWYKNLSGYRNAVKIY